MLSTEKHIAPHSHFYIHTPSTMARQFLMYPSIVGRFSYEEGYDLKRTHFDNFLIMLIESGTCTVVLNEKEISAPKGSVVLLDCYKLHEYRADVPWSALWMHFDGASVRGIYSYLTASNGNVFIPRHATGIRYELENILKDFMDHYAINEAMESLRINEILTYMIADTQNQTVRQTGIQKALIYIRDNFAKPIQLEDLAKTASLSPYYFSRLFTKETGVTPHQYIIATRLSAAKYALTTSDMTVKEVAYQCGFNDESSFCSAFKKYEHTTPSKYRKVPDVASMHRPE